MVKVEMSKAPTTSAASVTCNSSTSHSNHKNLENDSYKIEREHYDESDSNNEENVSDWDPVLDGEESILLPKIDDYDISLYDSDEDDENQSMDIHNDGSSGDGERVSLGKEKWKLTIFKVATVLLAESKLSKLFL